MTGADIGFDAQDVIDRTCTTKPKFRSDTDARRAARDDTTDSQPVKPYRCPFAGRRRNAHWHVGPVMSLAELGDIARVIRESS